MTTLHTMRRSLTVLTLALGMAWGAPAFAAEDAAAIDAQAATSLKSARKDSLELPGVTACHTCEWRPMKTEMETDQCTNKIGWFDCGRDTDCEKKCVFVKCSSE
jgi:hypothetical protein